MLIFIAYMPSHVYKRMWSFSIVDIVHKWRYTFTRFLKVVLIYLIHLKISFAKRVWNINKTVSSLMDAPRARKLHPTLSRRPASPYGNIEKVRKKKPLSKTWTILPVCSREREHNDVENASDVWNILVSSWPLHVTPFRTIGIRNEDAGDGEAAAGICGHCVGCLEHHSTTTAATMRAQGGKWQFPVTCQHTHTHTHMLDREKSTGDAFRDKQDTVKKKWMRKIVSTFILNA